MKIFKLCMDVLQLVRTTKPNKSNHVLAFNMKEQTRMKWSLFAVIKKGVTCRMGHVNQDVVVHLTPWDVSLEHHSKLMVTYVFVKFKVVGRIKFV